MSSYMPADAGALAPRSNLDRITTALGRGLHLPVRLDGTEVLGFVIRLDDAPFGPLAVIHVPEGRHLRVLYRDPEELFIVQPGESLRVQ